MQAEREQFFRSNLNLSAEEWSALRKRVFRLASGIPLQVESLGVLYPEDFHEPVLAPQNVILMVGLPGSGKSFFAAKLREKGWYRVGLQNA